MRKVRRSRRTHRQIARNPVVVDRASWASTQHSIGPCTRHYFPCEETGASITALYDAAKKMNLLDTTSAAGGVVLAEGDSPHTVKIDMWLGTPKALEAAWDPPRGNDCIILCAGRAEIDSSVNGDDHYGGFLSLYVGSGTNGGQFKVQPYYCVFYQPGTSGPFAIATPYCMDYANRQHGEDYIFAAVKRGNYIEHWANGVMTGMVDVVSKIHPHFGESGYDKFIDWQPTAFIAGSHSGYDAEPVLCKNEAASRLMEETGFACNECSEFELSSKTSKNRKNTDCQVCGPTFTLLGTEYANKDYYIYHERENGDREIPQSFFKCGTKIPDNRAAYAGERPTDYYGMMMCIFQDGAPDDIGDAMRWMLEQWKAGNKVVWPGWATLF